MFSLNAYISLMKMSDHGAFTVVKYIITNLKPLLDIRLYKLPICFYVYVCWSKFAYNILFLLSIGS